MTFVQQALWSYPEQISGATDFRDNSRVKESALPENKKVSVKGQKMKKQMNGVTCSSRLSDCCKDFPKKIDPNGCSVKMLKIFCLLMEDGAWQECSLVWTKQGTIASGKFSTLNTPTLSEKQLSILSRKTGSVCTLSAILEKEVAEKYFLSQEQTEKILLNCKG